MSEDHDVPLLDICVSPISVFLVLCLLSFGFLWSHHTEYLHAVPFTNYNATVTNRTKLQRHIFRSSNQTTTRHQIPSPNATTFTVLEISTQKSVINNVYQAALSLSYFATRLSINNSTSRVSKTAVQFTPFENINVKELMTSFGQSLPFNVSSTKPTPSHLFRLVRVPTPSRKHPSKKPSLPWRVEGGYTFPIGLANARRSLNGSWIHISGDSTIYQLYRGIVELFGGPSPKRFDYCHEIYQQINKVAVEYSSPILEQMLPDNIEAMDYCRNHHFRAHSEFKNPDFHVLISYSWKALMFSNITDVDVLLTGLPILANSLHWHRLLPNYHVSNAGLHGFGFHNTPTAPTMTRFAKDVRDYFTLLHTIPKVI